MWVLLIFMAGSDWSVTPVEFATEKACRDAGAASEKTTHGMMGWGKANISWTCTPKGN